MTAFWDWAGLVVAFLGGYFIRGWAEHLSYESDDQDRPEGWTE